MHCVYFIRNIRVLDNGIGSSGMKHIAKALKSNKVLTKLDINGKKRDFAYVNWFIIIG